MKRQSAVFVTVPAEELVGSFRARFQPRAIARRLPPHVTVVPPFMRDTDDEALVARLAEHFATVEPFAAEIARLGRFKRHVWLGPEPLERFVALLQHTAERFPEIAGDEGRKPVPHMTIAEIAKGQRIGDVLAAAEQELLPRLPLAFEVRDVALFEVRPEGWQEVCRFPLAMSTGLVRVTALVPLDRAEEARAVALDLAPGGFEEAETPAGLLLSLYVDEGSVVAVAAAFPGAATTPVAPGWEDRWKAFHRPARAGGLWIGPPWEQPGPGEPAVVIDPGRAFGTGAHPTTRLCVELLAGTASGSLLDVGCGSGVLAIAAARLGFGPIVAVDVDPVAVETTVANAAANGVELQARVLDGVAEPLPRTDVAVANVLLAPVEQILGRLEAPVAITSGYLVDDMPAHDGWEHDGRLELDGWAADRFVRHRQRAPER